MIDMYCAHMFYSVMLRRAALLSVRVRMHTTADVDAAFEHVQPAG